MMEPTYPPARAVAARVEAHFARNREEARQRGLTDLAPRPSTDTIERLINAAFWASLRREEGYSPKISLAYLPSERAGRPMCFDHPLPFTAGAMVRISPAVVRPGIHLGVWSHGEKLSIWGTARSLPCLCLVLEVVAPGLLVIKYRRREGTSKFGNVAVLRGDEIKIVDEHATRLLDDPPILTSLLSFNTGMLLRDSGMVLAQLAVSMREHGRGGALLVVPAENHSWRESVVWPIRYLIRPPMDEIGARMRGVPDEESEAAQQEALRRAIDAVAGLTAVDGATVIGSSFEVLAFGVKLRPSKRGTPISRVILTEPIEGNTPVMVDPTDLGGTRHLSAAQFVHDQRDTLALVASQDGPFTVFVWSPSEGAVRAHQIETLLL